MNCIMHDSKVRISPTGTFMGGGGVAKTPYKECKEWGSGVYWGVYNQS